MTTGRKWLSLLDVILILVSAVVVLLGAVTSCQAGELWRDEQGFVLEWGGWMDHELFIGWTGLRCGLTIPKGGWLAIGDAGALEVYIPGKGWVADKGIFITEGCYPDPQTDWDTAAPGVVNITEDMACGQEGDRVLMLVRLPKMSKKVSPTHARWVTREVAYHVEEPR